MILAIETATPVCSVAIETDARRIIEKRIEGKGVHSEYTFSFINELLDRTNTDVSDLEAVLFSKGPGSYTGLRIGAAATQGLLFSRDVPFYTYPTLLSYAAGVVEKQRSGTIHSVIDARREHLYRQKIEVQSPGNYSVSSAAVEKITDIEKDIHPGDIVTGTGWNRLTLKDSKRITFMGTGGISAKSLISAWYDVELKTWFENENVEQFEPDYLTMSQINNSEIRG